MYRLTTAPITKSASHVQIMCTMNRSRLPIHHRARNPSHRARMHFCTRPRHDVYRVHPSSELQRTQVWNVSTFCSKPVRSLKGCLVNSDKKKQVKKGESQVGGRKCGKSPWAMEMAKANWICVNYLVALSNGRGFKKKPGHAERKQTKHWQAQPEEFAARSSFLLDDNLAVGESGTSARPA